MPLVSALLSRNSFKSAISEMSLKKHYQEEPVVLTLSSDEEDDGNSSVPSKLTSSAVVNFKRTAATDCSGVVQQRLNDKEPIITPDFNNKCFERRHANYPGSYFQKGASSNCSSPAFSTLQCHNLRIGSYKVAPSERVLIACNGMEITVLPFAQGEKKPVTLTVSINDIIKILAHLGTTLQAIFLYLTPHAAEEIRKKLKMFDKNYYYFDPCSCEQSHRRMTIIAENMKPDNVHMIKNILNFNIIDVNHKTVNRLFEELSMKEANEILAGSSPAEVELSLPKSVGTYETATLFIYPPLPGKGGITVTTDDYCCLREEQFLNDVLIDFYLKWMHVNELSEEDRDRTHILSSFFYKRLTAKPKSGCNPYPVEDDHNISRAEKRHDRVRSWTKNVDIFTKDFILIPVNERRHWFLAVICYPGLDGPVRISDSQPLAAGDPPDLRRSSRMRKKFETIPIDDDDNDSDRDEAEGDDAEMEDYEEDEDESEPPTKKPKATSNAFKQPCILIFDSLPTRTRSNIVATLREYLSVEYLKKKGKPKEFNKVTMPGARPRVPQQTNFWDCGIFTLHFAEEFFQKPIENFLLPIRTLSKWFEQDIVDGKRKDIAKLIQDLLQHFQPDKNICLPPIQLSCQDKERTYQGEQSCHMDEAPLDTDCQGQEKGTEIQEEMSPVTVHHPSAGLRVNKKLSRMISLINKHPTTSVDEAVLPVSVDSTSKDIVSSSIASVTNSNLVTTAKPSSPYCEPHASDILKDKDSHTDIPSNGNESCQKRLVPKYGKPDYIKQLQKVKCNRQLVSLVSYSESDDSSSDDDIFLNTKLRKQKSTACGNNENDSFKSEVVSWLSNCNSNC